MSRSIEERAWLPRTDAVQLAEKLAEVGVYVKVEGSVRGWRVTLQGHTDLVDLCKVIDTMTVGEEPLHALYRPYGGDGWPDVLIYSGSKP